MTTALGDVVLVLLGDRPATTQELHRRHTAALGPQRQVDITRVVAALTRQERLGHVRTDVVLSRGPRRVWALTEAGDRRRGAWILDVGPDTDHEDIVVRVLLAVVGADRATFEAVIDAGVGVLQSRRRRGAARRAGTVSAAQALADFDGALVVTTLDWLRRLRGRARDRD